MMNTSLPGRDHYKAPPITKNIYIFIIYTRFAPFLINVMTIMNSLSPRTDGQHRLIF